MDRRLFLHAVAGGRPPRRAVRRSAAGESLSSVGVAAGLGLATGVLPILIGLLLLAAAPALADMTPTPPPTGLPPAAEQQYVAGVTATRAKEWSVAAAAFTRAVELKPTYAEAWNGLGYALRNQGKYAESLEAYGEALRLRPDYPEALEYLGEAYVKMGRLADARRVLERLKPLDPGRARELSEAIARGK